MKARWIAEEDDWGPGPSILDPAILGHLRSAIDDTPLIVEHWFYRGSRSPERLIFDAFEDLHQYLTQDWHPGDAFHVWRFDTSCPDGSEVAVGKLPDERGRVPKGGPY